MRRTGNMDAFEAGGKPKRRKPGTRLLWHKCNHREAWAGLLKMPPDEVGIYWRIILSQYIAKAAHHFDDDVEMARSCHTDLKTFRRLRDRLIARGRLEIDEENGLYFDKRAMSEMVEAGFLSEDAIAQAKKRWNKPPRVVVDNVVPLSTEAATDLLKYPLKSGSAHPSSQAQVVTVNEPEQEVSFLKCDASQNPESRIEFVSTSEAPAEPPARPLESGGGLIPTRLDQLTIAERKAIIRASFGDVSANLTEVGKDEGGGEADTNAPDPAGDRKARRS